MVEKEVSNASVKGAPSPQQEPGDEPTLGALLGLLPTGGSRKSSKPSIMSKKSTSPCSITPSLQKDPSGLDPNSEEKRMQYLLDFGQSDATRLGKLCPHCSLLYSPHLEEDRRIHAKFCVKAGKQKTSTSVVGGGERSSRGLRLTKEGFVDVVSEEALHIAEALSQATCPPRLPKSSKRSSKGASLLGAALIEKVPEASIPRGEHPEWEDLTVYTMRCNDVQELLLKAPELMQHLEAVGGFGAGCSSLFPAASETDGEPDLKRRIQCEEPHGTFVVFVVDEKIRRLCAAVSGRQHRRAQEPQFDEDPGTGKCLLQAHETLADLHHVWLLPLDRWENHWPQDEGKNVLEDRLAVQLGLKRSRKIGFPLALSGEGSSKEGEQEKIRAAVQKRLNGAVRLGIRTWCRKLIYGMLLCARNDVSYEADLCGHGKNELHLSSFSRLTSEKTREGTEPVSRWSTCLLWDYLKCWVGGEAEGLTWAPYVHHQEEEDEESETDFTIRDKEEE